MEPNANRHSQKDIPQIVVDFLSKYSATREYYSLMSSAFQSIDSSECPTEPDRFKEYLLNSLSKSGKFFFEDNTIINNYFNFM